MKKTKIIRLRLIVLTGVLIISGISVGRSQNRLCSTTASKQYIETYSGASKNIGFHYTYSSLPKIERTLSVSVHIVLNQSGSAGISNSAIEQNFQALNSIFAPIGLSFNVCNYNNVEDYNYDRLNANLDVHAEYEDLIHENYISNTINVYYVSSFTDDIEGAALLPGPEKTAVFLKKSSDVKTLAHEMGHYFGLLHTFETMGGTEYVSRTASWTNCETTGDFLCDTEADNTEGAYYVDENGQLLSTNGNVIPPGQDEKGDYYIYPYDNYMSYFVNFYREYIFTPQQYSVMIYNYYTYKADLW